MSFEEMLRDRLEHDAAAIPLPEREPDRAVSRARARRRHRMTLAGVAAVAALTAAAVPLVTRADHASRDEKAAIPERMGRLPTGPLHLAWRATPGGLRMPANASGDADGSIYALGTAAATDPRPQAGNIYATPTLYKLAADGTWQATPLDGDKPVARTVVSAGGKLYALSTAPASDGGSWLSRLSVSADGGQTWTGQDLPAADAPTGSKHLIRNAYAHIASNGKEVLAIVSTEFQVDENAVFPETKGNPGYLVEARPEGLVLVSYLGRVWSPAAGQAGGAVPPATTPAGQTPSTARVLPRREAPKVVRTVPYSEVGVRGRDALRPTQVVFRLDGDAWTPVPTDPDLHVQVADIHAAGDRFVIRGFTPGTPAPVFYVSDDAAHWQQLAAPQGDYIVGAGPSLVSIPRNGSTVRVSQDGGASWKDVALRVPPGSSVVGASGGELGVALVLSDGAYKSFDLAVSGDLASWTVTPLASVVGPGPVYEAWTFVGNDTIVVGAVKGDGPAPGGPSVTAVGTPLRG